MQNQRIVIVAEKIVTKNGRMYKILDVQATPFKKLPTEYIKRGYPFVVLAGNNLGISTASGYYFLEPGQIISEDCLEKIIADCKAAGDTLHKIRQEIKESGKNWKGIRTEVI